MSFREDAEVTDPRPPLQKLQVAFGIDQRMAQHFLDNMPIMVKRDASKEEARGYVQTLHNIGAEVRVERIAQETQQAPPPRYQSLASPTAPAAPAAPIQARPNPNKTMFGMASTEAKPTPPTPEPISPPLASPVPRDMMRQTLGPGNPLFTKEKEKEKDAPLFVPGLSPSADEGETDDPFGLQDWSDLTPEPSTGLQVPAPFPSNLDIMVGKGSPAPKAPASEDPRGVSQFDPNMQSMLGLGPMDDPGVLSTEEYQAVLDYAKADGEELLPGENFSFADESLDHDPLGEAIAASSPFGSISSSLEPESIPAMQAPSLPSNPFGDPLGQPVIAKPPAPAMGVNLESRMTSVDEDSPRSLSEITPEIVETRPPIRPSFDPAQAGAGLPTSEGPGMISQELPSLPVSSMPGTSGIKAAPMHHLPPGIQAVAPPDRAQVIPAAPRRTEFTMQDNGDGKSFWSAVPVAFVAPLKGKGALWIPLLGFLQVFAGCASSLPCMMIPGLAMICLYLGMMGTYFTSSVRAGMERQSTAPDLIDADMQTIKWEVLAKGAALGVLSVLLFAIPGLIWSTQVDPFTSGPELEKVRSFDQEEVFYTQDGKKAEINLGGKARVLYDEDDNEYLVNPLVNRVELLKAAPKTQETSFEALLPGLAMVFLSLMLAMLYWPMALTIHSLTNSLLSLFNPIPVFKGILSGGVKYLVVAGAPAVISVAFALFIGLSAGVGGMAGNDIGAAAATGLCSMLLGTCLYGYITGVQGHMIGRLLADQPEDFEDLA